MKPIAVGWIDYDRSTSPDWDAAQVQRLAKRLGYALIWPQECSPLPLSEQVRNADAEALITPTPDHIDPLTLNAVMHFADVETVSPRLSFARWSITGARV